MTLKNVCLHIENQFCCELPLFELYIKDRFLLVARFRGAFEVRMNSEQCEFKPELCVRCDGVAAPGRADEET